MLLGVQGLNGGRRAAASFLARYGDPTPQKSDKEPVLARPGILILARHTPTRAASLHMPRANADTGPGASSQLATRSSSLGSVGQ